MRRAIWAATLLLCLGSLASFADVMVETGNHPPFTTVHFNNGDASPPMAFLPGHVNPSNYQLDAIGTFITVSGDDIVAQAGQTFNAITFEPHAGFPNFTKMLLDVEVSDNANIVFSTAPNGINLSTDTFAVSKNGQNFFTITASNGQSIASLTASLSAGSFNSIDQVRVRAEGLIITPEPGTVSMMLAGLGMLALGLRRKNV